ncbi:MAG: sugar phosphate isomerase/epimerase [Oscillospiraceae bacterium]|nr:sugar phosphate isomerase/epimerase [Oscillospiraceae bacterium]
MNYGLQMYSVRDITENQMDYALSEVAAMGYSFVQFAGFADYTAEEIKSMLDKYNLSVYGTHIGWQQIENLDATIKYHKTIGNSNLIIPGADLSTKEKLDAFIDFINEYQPKVEAAGMLMHYHNHSHEFHPNNDGLYIHKELEERTNILFEIDTYWVYNAKLDPVETLERLKHRVKVIHLKDGDDKGEGFALGEGMAPIIDVIAKCNELGIVMVVESETLNPDGISEVRRCIDYLKTL